jgi:AcrR family transcriptional regulator
MRKPMTPLPAPFAGATSSPDGDRRLSKRERTHRQLVAASVAVFSRHGVSASTMHQIAAEAGMTTGTVYNHFHTKAEIVASVGRTIVGTVRARSVGARAALESGAERIAAGCWRYLGLAQSSPGWALLVLDVASVDPVFRETLSGFVGAELRLGLRRGEFSMPGEAVGLDLVVGATMEAMRRIASGTLGARASRAHATATVATVLRGLGVPGAKAKQIAAKPLPLFDR